MGKLFLWLFRAATGLIVLAVIGILLIYWFASRSLPDYDKTLRVSGLTSPVEIVRNNANVPHILGKQDADVLFGLGYAHAQDRLWQMLVMRWTAQGRLSEVFGTRTLQIDKLMRRLDIYTLSRRAAGSQAPHNEALLRAYAAGVNARLSEVNDSALGRGAPELFIFNAPIAPWTTTDSIAMGKLMALQLSGHLMNEVLRARVSLSLDDPERWKDLMPDAPGQGVATLPRYSALFPDLPRYAAGRGLDDHPLMPVKPTLLAGASNAFAAGPDRSASGGTLLANDPHLGFSAPGIWYLARLELAAGGVIGATIPGMPSVLTGRSERLGWGLTASYLDDQDLYIEQLNPQNPEEYRTPDGFKAFDTRKSIIRIKDADPVTITLRWTDNGPVLPGTEFDLGTVTPAGHVATLAWTALEDEDHTLGAGIALMSANSVNAAIKVLEGFSAPSVHVTMADRTEIAMKMVGRMPARDPGHLSKGRIPTQGWLPENRWQGFLPYDSNPEFRNPVGGILGNTNNKVVDRAFPEHVSYLWGDTQRVHRWRRLMQSREVHTRDSFIEAQLDTVSFTARSLLPLIGADLWFTGQAAPEGTPERLRQRALELLAGWNGEMNEHLPEPLIYAAWTRALQLRLIRDDIGPLAQEFAHVDPVFLERVYRDIEGASKWCDIRQSSPVETCVDIARMALDDALVWIDETYGTALESLRWGDAHQATHDHQVLGEVPVLRHFVNIRQSTSGGDNTLQRGVTSGKLPDPFMNVHGAGFRGVYDFADPDSSVFVISTGQSGHFLSHHYDDLAQLWRRGEYVPMSLDIDLARAANVGITRLQPAAP
jgi:penicillin amidase